MSAEHNHADPNAARSALLIALALNAAMFALELWQGLQASSTSLLADAADFASDSLSYIITLYVLTKPLHIRARASLFKAALMLLLAVAALTQGVYNIIENATPDAHTMGWVATLALVVNLTSAALLYRTRTNDSNLRSVWLCSRNDAFANIAILIAAGLVHFTDSLWPDLLVALFIAWIEGSSALRIIKQAKTELHEHD